MGRIVRVQNTPEEIERIRSEVDWERIDAMTDEDIARQVAENPDAAPLPEEVDVRAVIEASGAKSVPDFARRFHLNRRVVESWVSGRRAPADAAETLLRLIQRDPKKIEELLAE